MAVDNTHTKYLHGKDKKTWHNYKEALDAQSKFDNFMSGIDSVGGSGRQDIPLNKNKKKK